LSTAKEPQPSKDKNWQIPEQVVSRPLKLVHMLIIAIIFMLLGSYLSHRSAPVKIEVVVSQPASEVVVEVVETPHHEHKHDKHEKTVEVIKLTEL
jgi:hypothetical protein